MAQVSIYVGSSFDSRFGFLGFLVSGLKFRGDLVSNSPHFPALTACVLLHSPHDLRKPARSKGETKFPALNRK
jgi:hypothetical protein